MSPAFGPVASATNHLQPGSRRATASGMHQMSLSNTDLRSSFVPSISRRDRSAGRPADVSHSFAMARTDARLAPTAQLSPPRRRAAPIEPRRGLLGPLPVIGGTDDVSRSSTGRGRTRISGPMPRSSWRRLLARSTAGSPSAKPRAAASGAAAQRELRLAALRLPAYLRRGYRIVRDGGGHGLIESWPPPSTKLSLDVAPPPHAGEVRRLPAAGSCGRFSFLRSARIRRGRSSGV